MYMVLAAQFESLVHPIVILLTVPLSIRRAAVADCDRPPLDLFSVLGILLLPSFVKKNGILQIDCMNRLGAQGYSVCDAVMEGNHVRLRPILLTTLSIVALIPTAVGIRASASQCSVIAVTIIGGQLLCQVLSLLVVPVAYSYVEQARAWITRRRLPL
jgi:hydrophobic/amphiphilic exporter-1 (mainly G- bacteria), HAE1 family